MAFVAPFIAPMLASATGISAAAISTGLTVAGTAFSAFGALSSAKAQSDTASRNAQAEVYNSQIAQNNATQALRSASLAAKEEREAGRRRGATIRSRFAKGGVVTTAGSPLLAQQEQAQETGIESNKILQQGRMQANSFQFQSNISQMKAQSFRQEAKSAKTAGFLSAGQKILTGTSLL
jgi:hypothetical protein